MSIKSAHRFFISVENNYELLDKYQMYVGGTGFVILFKEKMFFITAAHAAGVSDGVIGPKAYGVFLIMPDVLGGPKVVSLNKLILPSKKMECEHHDFIIYEVNNEDKKLIDGFIDNSNAEKTVTAESLINGDELVLIGYPFVPNTEPIDFERKIITDHPLTVFLKYDRLERDGFIHRASLDELMNDNLSIQTDVLDGISGSVVLLKRGLELSWAGMVITAGGDYVRFIDANLIESLIISS